MSKKGSQAELHRLHILHEYFSPQLPLPKDLDELVEVAAQLCGTSMAAIGFVDEDHERYAVTQGFAPTAVNRFSSLGELVISEGKPVAVGDVRHDPRFSQCKPVVDELDVAFYAAAPLIAAGGAAIGELAVMDDHSIELSVEQLHGLETLASQVMVHLDRWRRERTGADQTADADLAVDFQDIFRAVPDLYLAVTPHDFRVVAVSDAFLASAARRREDIIGKCIFDVFPADPEDPASQDNMASLKASLQRVRDTRREHALPVQRYPIPSPEGGRFEERYWSAINKPVLTRDGQLKYILHRTEDITERKQTEFDAELLGERLSTVLENISDAFLTLDNDWRVTFMNSKAVELLQRSREELLGHNVWESFPEAIDTLFFKMYHLARKENRTVRFEEYFAPLDIWVDVSVFPSPQGLAVYFRDISERKKIEAVKRESEEITMLILENALDAVITIGSDSVIKVWNSKAEQVFGRSQQEAVGRKLYELIIPERYRDAHRRGLAHFLEKGEGPLLNRRVETFGVRKDGEEFPVELAISPIKTSAGYTFSAFVRDITEQKEYERKLSRQAALLDKAQDAIIVCDSENRIQYWNKSAERLYGWTSGEVLGQSKEELLYHDPHPYREAVGQVMERGEWAGEIEQRRKDGSSITVEGAWSLVNDEKDAPPAVLAINTDITERLALEEQLRQAQRLEAIGQLTGGVAHDFNNLLTVILGNAEMMVAQLPPQDPLHKLADMTRTAALRGSDLTHRLLAFARRQALEPKKVDVNHLIAEMESLLRRALPEYVHIDVMLSDDLWHAHVDPAQLESVLLNLALNSKDAMPEGGRLTIETANAELDEEYAAQHAEVAPGRYVMIAVSDTGAGIPAEALERVFDPFYTTKEQGKGTGLGLSMAYGFAKQSEGHINIYSELGQGTTVKVYLPRVSRPGEAATLASQGDRPAHGTEKILVVEDDDLVRDYAQNQLEQLGYDVIVAANGAEALEVLDRDPGIDLLFTDVIMSGGMNGPELAEKARQLRPDLKVLYTSGYTENAIVHHGRLDAGVQLLQKPYQRTDLAQKIRHVLT